MASHLDLVDLRLIVHIGDAQSLTRGAEKSHLSLPAASNRVKNLENHLGTRLFNRNNQGVTLTSSGEAFVRHARKVIKQINHLQGDMQEFTRGIKGHIKVLANTTAMSEFMPNILAKFLAQHCDVTVELRERLSYLVVKAVAEGSADLGIVAGQPSAHGVEYLPYRRDRLALVTDMKHPLAKQTEVSFVDTLQYDYVSLSEWSAINAFLIQAADNLGVNFRFRVEVGSFDSVCRMIEAGVGVGVVPERVATRYSQSMKIKIIRLADDWAERKLYICVREYEALPSFARALVDMMQEDARQATS